MRYLQWLFSGTFPYQKNPHGTIRLVYRNDNSSILCPSHLHGQEPSLARCLRYAAQRLASMVLGKFIVPQGIIGRLALQKSTAISARHGSFQWLT
jgi:hypothetical protein